MGWRRLVRRLSFVFAAVLAVAALTPALAHGDTVDESHRPTVFAGIGAATGVHQEFNGNAGLAATVEPVHGSLPDGLVDFGSDVSRARAATYYPGATVAGLGELWCGQVAPVFPFPNPECPLPAFPTSVYQQTLQTPLLVRDGMVQVPQAPGLGVELQEWIFG